ncbi:MAG: cytidine deaminase [Bacteroidales bacterium]|nr:cytidine deaminase [Bacteroidales bacterium]
MEEKNIIINYTEYNCEEELPQLEKRLLEKAIQATSSSYAPYSKFNVGAAVLMGNGEVVTGSNQENAASPSGLCAERVALFAAHHMYPNEPVKAIAIAAKQNGKITEDLTYPCAACIQVMVESQKRSGGPIKIIVGSSGKVQVFGSVDTLLPFSFGNLNK